MSLLVDVMSNQNHIYIPTNYINIIDIFVVLVYLFAINRVGVPGTVYATISFNLSGFLFLPLQA